MLLQRSIILTVVLLVLGLSNSQEYGDEDDDNSDFTEGADHHNHPDYSKFYSVEGSQSVNAPQVYGKGLSSQLGVPALEFTPQQLQGSQSVNSFAPLQDVAGFFSASAPVRDYFEESQKRDVVAKQPQDATYLGSQFYSHPLLSSATAEDVEHVKPKANRPKKNYRNYDSDISIPDYTYTKPQVDYNIGKSSSTVSQYPSAQGSLDVGLGLTPYQKENYKPLIPASSEHLKSYDPLYSTTAPYNAGYEKFVASAITANPEATETVSKELKNKNCRKLVKPASENHDKMNCFVCEDEDNKSKYTQCSYSSEDEPKEYYKENSEIYTVPVKAPPARLKRYSNKHDPYYVIKKRSQKSFAEPTIPEGYDSGFLYDYDESRPELSYSERESEEIKKDPKNCKKVEKDGSICTICKNPDTGGNFEQCSYTSEPQEKKYAYVTEKKYDSNEPDETKNIPKTRTVQLSQESKHKPLEIVTSNIKRDTEPIEEHESRREQRKYPKKRDDGNREESPEREPKKLVNDENYDIPKHFAESIHSETTHDDNDNENDNENDKENAENEDESEENTSNSDFDEYHIKLFPELSKQKDSNEDDNEYHVPAASKQNVDEVLAEFSKKDRSSCKKAEKNGMTCYLCVDENKIQHEECMYVQESRPKSSHLAYHQVKGVKEDDESEPEETRTKNNVVEVNSPTTPFLVAAASEESEVKVPYIPVKHNVKSKRSSKNKKKTDRTQEAEPTIETPTEFQASEEEGAFSDETKAVYSKEHGVNLPKYMVDKSDFEKEFDAFSGRI